MTCNNSKRAMMLTGGYTDDIVVIALDPFYFFFSSRRRHTRLQGDWSSDVCSSDLHAGCQSEYALRPIRPCDEISAQFGRARRPRPRLDRHAGDSPLDAVESEAALALDRKSVV